jgi:hypothetical protein
MRNHCRRLPALAWLSAFAFAIAGPLASVPVLAAGKAAAPQASAPVPSWEGALSQVTAIPKESALRLLRLLKPEGPRPGEKVDTFEVKPWEGMPDTWLVLLSVEGCDPIEGNPVNTNRAPWLWLALASVSPRSGETVLLARPVGGFLQAWQYGGHSHSLGGGPIRLGPGKQGFVVSHGFRIPFSGGGADVNVEHLFLLRHGAIVPVFDVVRQYSAMYGGEWYEDGTRDHPEEHVSLDWEVAKKATSGFFNLRVRETETETGLRPRHAVYTWQGDGYATAAKDFFSNQELCLSEGQLVPPPERWQNDWLAGELARRLAADDAEGVMALDMGFQKQVRQGDGVFDKAARTRILALAHRAALAGYKTDAARALRLLGYGIVQASSGSAGVEDKVLEATSSMVEALLEVTDTGSLAALNDYAFILATKTKDNGARAASLLRAVLDLDPKRTVAHLNLADALWGQGKKDEAREHYRRYRELSGKDAQDMPPRVLDRAR